MTLGYSVSGEASRQYATSSAACRLFKAPMVSYRSVLPDAFDTDAYPLLVKVWGYRNTGTNDLYVDYVAIFPRPYMMVKNGSVFAEIWIKGRTIETRAASVPAASYMLPVGDTIEFTPNRYNLLQSLLGAENEDPVISSTLTYDIYYTPRYTIL